MSKKFAAQQRNFKYWISKAHGKSLFLSQNRSKSINKTKKNRLRRGSIKNNSKQWLFLIQLQNRREAAIFFGNPPFFLIQNLY